MSQAADSAGIPFAGRELRDHPFKDDDGSRPALLDQALSAWREAFSGTNDHDLAVATAGMVTALRESRVVVPLVAEAGEIGYTDDGLAVEKTQELSIVTVEGPHGNPVGLMFSSVADMATWRADARPIPVEVGRVAAWALTEDISQVVLDPAAEIPVVCRRGVLWAIVNDSDYVAPWLDTDVVDVIEARELWGKIPGLVSISVHSGWRLDGGVGPDVVARVALRPGLDREALDTVTQAIAEAWAEHPKRLALVDGVRLELVAQTV